MRNFSPNYTDRIEELRQSGLTPEQAKEEELQRLGKVVADCREAILAIPENDHARRREAVSKFNEACQAYAQAKTQETPTTHLLPDHHVRRTRLVKTDPVTPQRGIFSR